MMPCPNFFSCKITFSPRFFRYEKFIVVHQLPLCHVSCFPRILAVFWVTNFVRNSMSCKILTWFLSGWIWNRVFFSGCDCNANMQTWLFSANGTVDYCCGFCRYQFYDYIYLHYQQCWIQVNILWWIKMLDSDDAWYDNSNTELCTLAKRKLNIQLRLWRPRVELVFKI